METTFTNFDDYKVNLDVFEGPLDLLLYLIKKNDLEITDIKVAIITDEYLKYLDAMEEMNVNVAGEYLLMAAELVQIKSKMLLPVDSVGEVDELEEDPRADLMKRLLEYKRYKEAAAGILGRPILYKDEYIQMSPEKLEGRREVLADENVFRLLEAFQVMLKKMPSERMQEVTIDRISVNERIMQIVDKIKVEQTIQLEALIPEAFTKYDLVITFLALLEMAKLAMIKVYQAGKCQPLYITGCMRDVSEEEMLQLVDTE